MQGIVLNEDGYVTYPAEIFECIANEVKSLNWRISNVECGSDGTGFSFPFEACDDSFISGEELYNLLQAHPQIQWWWGILSGFPQNIEWSVIRKNPIIYVQNEAPYLGKELRHIEPNAVLEIIAFDSTETYVLADSDTVIKKLQQKYTNWESLEKYLD